MTCEDVRERLAEHLMGAVEGEELAQVRRHLRGCAACRAEMSALDDGLAAFSLAAHNVEPPDELEQRVLNVLEEEWSHEQSHRRPRPLARRLAWAAVGLILAGSVAWGLGVRWTADRYEAEAAQWERFLTALGGEEVQVGTFRAVGMQDFEGSVVLYDSDEGQSWALVLARAPGRRGSSTVTLLGEDRSFRLPDLEFGEGGRAHTLLVTESRLDRFHTVTVTDNSGAVLATATLSDDSA